MPFDYQRNRRFFAQTAGGLEDLGALELTGLGASDVQAAYRGLYFTADQATLYRINYCSRILGRVLAPLLAFPCHSDRYLYKRAKEIPWPELIGPGRTLAVSANVANSRIRNSHYATLRLKDALVDRFREEGLPRPAVDRQAPDIRINLHIADNRATVSLDTSGESLHRRGYRKEQVEAPMRETLAAAILHLSGWSGARPLYDPMCGSGTLLCEGLMQACRVPSGYLKSAFGFEALPDHDPGLWKAVRAELDGRICPLSAGLIAGSDQAPRAVAASRRNLDTLPSGSGVPVYRKGFQEIRELENRTILCNPPYGLRMGKGDGLGELYKAFGDFLKQRCQGSTAYVYFGNRDMIPKIGLRPSWKRPLSNARLDGRLARFEIY